MGLHVESEMPLRDANLPVVGLLSWSDLGDACLDCLSEREERLLGCLRHGLRRRSWLAGRIAAKFCFLNAFGAQTSAGSDAWMPRFIKVGSKFLRGFSSWMYRQVEIVTDSLRPGNPPRLAWGGQQSDVRVSLSHANGQSCAYLDSSGAIGLDLEEAVVRGDAFYRGNFSVRERAWVDQVERETGAGSAWLYTLLWTLKEAAFKSNDSDESTLWGMPLIEVMMPAELGDLALAAQRLGSGSAFAWSRARVSQHGSESRFHVGILADAGSVLSVLRKIEPTKGA
jgi:phosphopantetheinyl transferase (holo-ACP synthase)